MYNNDSHQFDDFFVESIINAQSKLIDLDELISRNFGLVKPFSQLHSAVISRKN